MARKLSLLEQAQQVVRTDKRLAKITQEEIELALAWINDEVSLTNIAKVINANGPGAVASKLSIWLREAYRLGLLRIK